MSLGRLAFLIVVALVWQGAAMAEQPGHVTGIGGVFVKSKDPKALVQWYREVLGIPVRSFFETDASAGQMDGDLASQQQPASCQFLRREMLDDTSPKSGVEPCIGRRYLRAS